MSKKSSVEYLCPYTEIKFTGSCPVKKCVAYIGKNHKSGCAHNVFNLENKKIELAELSVIYGKSIEEIEELNKEGIKEIYNVISIIELFENFKHSKENEADNYVGHKCKCGKILKSVDDCPHDDSINEKELYIRKILKKYPFNINELDINQISIHLFIQYLKRTLGVDKTKEILGFSGRKLRAVENCWTVEKYRKSKKRNHNIR